MTITALPAPCGVGTLGADARAFLDFLSEAGKRCWQILPIGPTGYGDSPYQSCSSFAGNPYLIDLEDLRAAGLLLREEYENLNWGNDCLLYTSSIPPATTISASPAWIICAAILTQFRPEPQTIFTVTAVDV